MSRNQLNQKFKRGPIYVIIYNASPHELFELELWIQLKSLSYLALIAPPERRVA